MKYTNILLLSAFLVVFTACNKHHNNSANAGEGYWTLTSKQYTITKTERSTSSSYFVLSGFDTAAPSNSINFYFPLTPSVSGKYRVVPFSENSTLNARELGIKVNIPSTGIFSSTGTADSRSWIIADSAEVTLNNGKIVIGVPQMCTIITTATYLDSVLLKAVIVEK